jgi:hypothetical protein
LSAAAAAALCANGLHSNRCAAACGVGMSVFTSSASSVLYRPPPNTWKFNVLHLFFVWCCCRTRPGCSRVQRWRFLLLAPSYNCIMAASCTCLVVLQAQALVQQAATLALSFAPSYT